MGFATLADPTDICKPWRSATGRAPFKGHDLQEDTQEFAQGPVWICCCEPPPCNSSRVSLCKSASAQSCEICTVMVSTCHCHCLLLCAAVCCCLSLAAASCCWLLLAAAGCWLMPAGACWLLLAAAGCCCAAAGASAAVLQLLLLLPVLLLPPPSRGTTELGQEMLSGMKAHIWPSSTVPSFCPASTAGVRETCT